MFRIGTLALVAGFVGLVAPGCAAEYVHDAAAFYPADFEVSYTKVTDCSVSSGHGGKYVVVYANASADTALNDTAATVYPEGAVFVKAQYETSDCSGVYASLTAMRKDAAGSGTTADWKWQSIADSGDIDMENYDAPGCIGCHQTGGGKDLVKTE